MHSLLKPRLAMMSRPACGCRATRRVSTSFKNPSAAIVMETVVAELQRDVSLTLTLRHLAASSGNKLTARATSCGVLGHCCAVQEKLQDLCDLTVLLSRRLLWPHALCSASAGDHSLVQGLKGDATYLVVTDQGEIEKYGINGVALHPKLKREDNVEDCPPTFHCTSACTVIWEMPWQRCPKKDL